MAETITKKMFQIGDIAVLANQSGENFLYDTKENKLIGQGDVAYTTSFLKKSDYSCGTVGDVKREMILQKTEDGKRCRIYDVMNKNMIVENWELVDVSDKYDSDLVVILKNPKTGKFHIFNSCFMGHEGYDIFETEFDNVERCDSKSIAPLVLTLYGKKAYYYSHYGLVTGFDYDDIEQIIQDHIIVTNGNDKQYVLDGNLAEMSPIYEDIKVSGNEKHSSSTVNYYLYCSKDDYTDIIRASWRGISRKFKAERYDKIEHITTMTEDKNNKDVPTKYFYYFFGEKDGETYLLKGTATDKTEAKTTIPIKPIAHITKIEPLGKNAKVLHADNGKQGLLISYPDDINDYDRRNKNELFEPNNDKVFRFGNNYIFALQKGKKATIYSSNLTFQSKGGFFDTDIEILETNGDKIAFKKNNSFGIGEISGSRFYERHGYSNVRYLGNGFYEYTEDGKKGVYDTINNVCQEIYYVGPKEGKSRTSKQIFIVKSSGKYEWIEYDPCCPPDPRYDPIEVRNEGKHYLKADKLSICGRMINAIKDKKSTLYTINGTVIKSYDNPVTVSIQEEMGEALYAVQNKSNVDYFEHKGDNFSPVEIITIDQDTKQGVQKKKSFSSRTVQKKDE